MLAPMMTTDDLHTFFERGWNRHDVDLLMTFMAEDCVYESTAGPEACGTRHAGRQPVRRAFARAPHGLPDAPVAAPAVGRETRVDRRRERQEQRIDEGVKCGALTPRETRKLERGQQHVEKLETKAQADGVVTPKEKARLEHAQDVQSKRIYKQKH